MVEKIDLTPFRALADKVYAESDLAQLENDLKAIGLYRAKAKNIRACCRILVDKHGGQVPQSMDELVELPGVGQYLSNVMWVIRMPYRLESY